MKYCGRGMRYACSALSSGRLTKSGLRAIILNMKTILVTGFMPFGGEEMNPAWEAAVRLPEQIHGVQIHSVQIPVSYRRSWETLEAQLAQIQPSALLLIGQAGGRARITPERYARNEMRAESADSDGVVCRGEAVSEGGEYLLSSALALKLAGEETPLSEDAGRYVCNCLYYQALRHFDGPCVFVHVPYCEQSLGAKDGKPFMQMENIAEGIRRIAEKIAEEI